MAHVLAQRQFQDECTAKWHTLFILDGPPTPEQAAHMDYIQFACGDPFAAESERDPAYQPRRLPSPGAVVLLLVLILVGLIGALYAITVL